MMKGHKSSSASPGFSSYVTTVDAAVTTTPRPHRAQCAIIGRCPQNLWITVAIRHGSEAAEFNGTAMQDKSCYPRLRFGSRLFFIRSIFRCRNSSRAGWRPHSTICLRWKCRSAICASETRISVTQRSPRSMSHRHPALVMN